MTEATSLQEHLPEQVVLPKGSAVRGGRGWRVTGVGLAVGLFIAVGLIAPGVWRGATPPQPPPAPPPEVTVSTPLQQSVQATTRLLGQFMAVNSVEIRAQVGGTLSSIDFRDGQIVHAGQKLFSIDPRPFQIRLEQAAAQLQTAESREKLAAAELWRAQQLKRTDFGTAESVDTRAAEERQAQAAVTSAQSAIRDAQLDLEFAQITAPFAGRMGARQVSLGSLVSGSRGGAGQSTLLATVVSIDPIYLAFDMSEADYVAYQKAAGTSDPSADVAISVSGDGPFDRHGTLDFIDNAVNRSSGTIRARATVPNADGLLTPGQFARLRLSLGKPMPALLLPASAVLPDQSRQIVLTVAADGTVVPKVVELGDIQSGLRVIWSGLLATDRVVIDGLVRARPGAKVTAVVGEIKPNPAAQ